MEFMTRGVFDALIYIFIIVGLILAALRIRADLTRPMRDDEDDTDPHNPSRS